MRQYYRPATMLVLALDTTTKTGSCALARGGRVVREEASDAERGHAERLPGDLARLLERSEVTLADIDVFAVATGPGSFTGLRIGIATMQGLAMAAGKPLVGVSALDALCSIAADHKGPPRTSSTDAARALAARVATWVDAWRGEVYAALYEDGREVMPAAVARPDALLEPLRGLDVLFVGDGAATFRDSIAATLGDRARFPDTLTPPLAGTIALLAAARAAAGETPPPHAIRPLYVRRPDPELARARGAQPLDTLGAVPSNVEGQGSAPHQK
jgi:tRNA threonylcarbamoyladenosine biosynthesis protein TsaB